MISSSFRPPFRLINTRPSRFRYYCHPHPESHRLSSQQKQQSHHHTTLVAYRWSRRLTPVSVICPATAHALATSLQRPLTSSPPSRTTSAASPQREEMPGTMTSEEWEKASSAGKIKWLLSTGGDDAKWGWVVYRTSYKPELDVAWEILQRLIVDKSQNHIARSDAPEILDKMDWVFVSEPAAELERATRDELRQRFSTFVRIEAPYLPKEVEPGESRGSRFEVFLQADEGALLSLLQGGGGYVNIVKGWLETFPPDNATDENGEPFDPEDWMKMRVSMVDTESYVEMDHPESWYMNYRPPPHCVWGS